jgi:hypothetical protein
LRWPPAKRVIRDGGCSYLNGVLVDDVLVGLGKTLFVVDIPPQGLEERINEFSSDLSFILSQYPDVCIGDNGMSIQLRFRSAYPDSAYAK